MGVSVAAVCMWESTGKDHSTSPTQRNLETFVEALGITMERFYGDVPKRRAATSKKRRAA